MKKVTRVVAALIAVPAAGAFLLGCPKKATQTQATPEPRVSQSVVATRPGGAATEGGAASTGSGAGTAKQPQQTEDQRLAQLLASRGEDIPIKDQPTVEFVEPGQDEKSVLKTVYFDYDKSNIRPEFQTVLEGVARWMTKMPERQVLIEGHCDERGTDEYNLALGERRALAVRRYLVALGVPAERLHTISYGEEKPADPGHDETAWAKNRRAEFKVSAK
ncbi:MAG TPA: peptidoglycan-associated lipoprotein Pal [bacterium]